MSQIRFTDQLNRARQSLQAGNTSQARLIAEGVLQKRKKNVDALEILAVAAQQESDYEQAAIFMKQCVTLRPKDARLRLVLAEIYTGCARYREAIAQFEKGLKLAPDRLDAVTGLGQVFERRGEYAKCRALFEPYIRQGRETVEMAAVQAEVDVHEGRLDEAIDLTRRHLDRTDASKHAQLRLRCAMGAAYEKKGDFAEAFEACRRGNEAARVAFDPAAYSAHVDQLIDVFTPEALSALPRATSNDPLPVFIVGMPRSGSTLAESILAAHPRVTGGGELIYLYSVIESMPMTIGSNLPYPDCMADLDQRDVDQLAQTYVDRLRSIDPRAARIVDKSLANYLHLGVVACLLPGAKIIHTRRNPLDTCLSCFMQPLHPPATPYASDLNHLGKVYRDYERLMAHWRGGLDVRMLEIDYEDVVADKEDAARRLIDFCELDWDDACLAFDRSRRAVATASYDQVRRPIYTTSVKRSERFAPFLDPLRAALGMDEA